MVTGITSTPKRPVTQDTFSVLKRVGIIRSKVGVSMELGVATCGKNGVNVTMFMVTTSAAITDDVVMVTAERTLFLLSPGSIFVSLTVERV